MPIEERTEFRQTKKISISGYQVPQAISSFGQLQGTIERVRPYQHISTYKYIEMLLSSSKYILLDDVLALDHISSSGTLDEHPAPAMDYSNSRPGTVYPGCSLRKGPDRPGLYWKWEDRSLSRASSTACL